MLITNRELVQLSMNLNSFNERKTPFSLTVVKNLKIIESLFQEYTKQRDELIQKYATMDENGAYLGKTQDDGTRIQEPKTLHEIEVENLDELLGLIGALELSEVDLVLSPIDLDKVYYDSKLEQKCTISDYIESNLEPQLIQYFISVGLIEI